MSIQKSPSKLHLFSNPCSEASSCPWSLLSLHRMLCHRVIRHKPDQRDVYPLTRARYLPVCACAVWSVVARIFWGGFEGLRIFFFFILVWRFDDITPLTGFSPTNRGAETLTAQIMASGSDDSNPIYGNVDAVFFHHLVTTGGLIGWVLNASFFRM